MANKKYYIFGICFFILAMFLLSLYAPKPPLLSITQTSRSKNPYLDDGFVKGIILVQELNVKKEYLNGFQIRYITMERENTNSNTVVVLDSQNNLIFQEKFSSKEIEDRKFHDFRFKESLKIGKGNKISICFISKDGDSANCVHGLFNAESKLGALYACAEVNDDLISSVNGKKYPYPGAIMLRTYESDHSLTTSIRNLLYFVAFLVAIAISFFKRIQQFLTRIHIRPEYVYLIFAIVFGSLFVFLTPPMQVPDEGSHLSRTVELSEFQFSGTKKSIPSSFMIMDSTLGKLRAYPDERTSKDEIRALANVKINPDKRMPSSGPDYVVPYFPQVLGLFTGKIFSSAPLVLMYFGRLFNLLFSVLLIFLAIRITPFSKWIFFLLALMPKTLFLMASLSYDAFVISSSFLLTAMFLYYAFNSDKVLKWKDIGMLFFVWLLLALCKPPYFILGFLVFIIPFRKMRFLSKYLIIFSAIVVTALLAYGVWSLTGGLMKSADAVKTERVARQEQPVKANKDVTPATTAPVAPHPEINPPKQLNYIRSHPTTFMALIFATNFDHMRADILSNFVGTMGWLDTFLPNTLINLYLILLLITALCIAEQKVHVDWRRKLLFFILFLSGVLAIETAMYIYASFVAQEKLFGVQGRYFIPLAPLFLLIFYNNVVAKKLNYLFSTRREAFKKAKPNMKPKILLEIDREQIFSKYMQVFIIGFTTVALIRGIAAVLLRYYQW